MDYLQLKVHVKNVNLIRTLGKEQKENADVVYCNKVWIFFFSDLFIKVILFIPCFDVCYG